MTNLPKITLSDINLMQLDLELSEVKESKNPLSLDNEFENIKPESSELRISTMTGVCNISSKVNLNVIYNYLVLDKYIKYIEYGNFPTKGLKIKQISDKKANKKKVFFNQITILISIDNHDANIKLFNNGSISMTGLKSEKIGIKAVEYLISLIKIAKMDENNETIYAVNNKDECKLNDFKIVLINSDFYAGFEIKRSELHQLLINDYNIFSSYEPCIYPGVNSKFYWNKEYLNNKFRGKCCCTVSCDGKGNGEGNGKCKKVTIATFQSGSIIITGARNLVQVRDAYNFINSVFKTHYNILKKKNAPFLDFEDSLSVVKKNSKDNIIYIKKKNISMKYK